MDQEFQRQMQMAQQIMDEDHDILAALANAGPTGKDLLAQELAAVRANWEPYVTDLQVKAGRILCIQKLLYTWALLADLTPWGHAPDGRWCYSSYEKAKAALDAWSGEDGTEPDGFHRHPNSGRRRDPDGREYVQP